MLLLLLLLLLVQLLLAYQRGCADVKRLPDCCVRTLSCMLQLLQHQHLTPHPLVQFSSG